MRSMDSELGVLVVIIDDNLIAQHVIVQRLISVADRKPGPGQCPKEIKNQELLKKTFYHAAHHVIPLAKNNMMGGGY